MRKLKKQWDTFPVHSKERAVQRYGVRFSRKQEKKFYEQLGGHNSIYLSKHRRAVYFSKRWYLVMQAANGMVTTFLPPEALTEQEKVRLKSDKNYCRINDDQFQVGIAVIPIQNLALPKRTVPLPLPVQDKELPPDFDAAEQLMDISSRPGKSISIRIGDI